MGINRQLAGLLAIFVWSADAHAFECASSADAVKQLHPDAWPSWTLRAPGHEGSRCWYASKRGMAHQHPKWTAAPDRAPRNAEPELGGGSAALNVPPPRPDTPSSLPSAVDVRGGYRVASVPTAETIPDETGSVRVAEDTTNGELGIRRESVDEADLRRNDLPLKLAANSNEPVRAADQTFSTPALLAVFSGALVFASLMAGLMNRLRRLPS